MFDDSKIADLVNNREYVMGDKGYIGIGRSVSALLPLKKPRNGTLTQDQTDWNTALGHRRILVEHVFGRIKKWKILKNRWIAKTNRLEWYSEVFTLCCALTNILNWANLTNQ